MKLDRVTKQQGKYFHILNESETKVLFESFGDIFARIFELQLHD
jgi:hypothetical protein